MRTLWLSALVLLASAAAHAWQPVGSLQELHDPALVPLLRPGVKAAMFSSYDRTGGNNDGFNGTYSKLREEDGNSVIAEMDGPGAIQRIWFTHSEHRQDGLLERKGEHIRVYIDGAETPALDVPLEALFDGRLPRFPKPLAGSGIGGFYCYVPIPYTKSCKVVVDGLGVRFYQITYSTFPSAEGVTPFSMELKEEELAHLARAVERWNNPLGVFQTDGVQRHSGEEQEGGDALSVNATGPALVLGCTFEGDLGDGVIEVLQAGGNTISLPLDLFFCATALGAAEHGYYAGKNGAVYYNLLPFYTDGRSGYTLRARGVKGTLTMYTLPVETVPANAGRLAAQHNESLPTVPDIHHPFLKTSGQGHYVGTFLTTSGPEGKPYWLEGDDKWTLDGELRIHGTGSEDYFNCGWYAVENRLNGPAGFASHGFPVYGITDGGMHAHAYRWHITDPVPYDHTIVAEMEHGEANQHIANYRSVGWYYEK